MLTIGSGKKSFENIDNGQRRTKEPVYHISYLEEAFSSGELINYSKRCSDTSDKSQLSLTCIHLSTGSRHSLVLEWIQHRPRCASSWTFEHGFWIVYFLIIVLKYFFIMIIIFILSTGYYPNKDEARKIYPSCKTS